MTHRLCPTPYCGAIITTGTHCDRCRRLREHARKSSIARGYDHAWARYSTAWLRRHRICGERGDGQLHAEHSRCVQAGLRTPATVTDHIQAIADGGDRFLGSNHQSLCNACNVAKSVRPVSR